MMDQPDPQDQPPDAAAGGRPRTVAGAGRSTGRDRRRLPGRRPRRCSRASAAAPAGASSPRSCSCPGPLGYGSVGAWAVAFGARGVAGGHAIVDAGYTRW